MPDRVSEIRARLDAAISGPWMEDGSEIVTAAVDDMGLHTFVCDVWHSNPTADLIAHAPDDLRWLLDRVAELEKRVRMYEVVKS